MGEQNNMRVERDSLGPVEIPADRLWGAQSQRSLGNFAIGSDRFAPVFIHDFALLKKACALANAELGDLGAEESRLIQLACDEIMASKHDLEFPLSVWQTGSGTQTNMNLNEVIANLGNREVGAELGSGHPLHPNDHVNRSQSSNDTFPTVMHITATRLVQTFLLPALDHSIDALATKEKEFENKIKSGRTHMMDATPVTLGQEFGAFRAQLSNAGEQIRASLKGLTELAIGGTAVGTGLNTRHNWAETVVRHISELSGMDFIPAANKFAQLAGHDALLDLHNRLNLLATALFKMANDIRLMNSGPRCGLAELTVPANEPGSSIMPGKVNPTQVEALTMVCCRVMGNNTTVSIANSQGQFQLNVFKPVIIHSVMESITLLADAMRSFTDNCLAGITANDEQLARYTERSLMLVTALNPHIGYDNAARAAKLAHEKNITLREAVLELELLSGEQYDELVRPESMLGPS
ncbi:MAG: class II fumarate hydratase [Pseudohongiellaceae bacterium]